MNKNILISLEKENLLVVGKPVNRIDAVAKVTGTAKYIADFTFPNMLYGKVLHAGIPHAKILSIDVENAKKLPGVVAILTAKDVTGRNIIGKNILDQPIIAEDKVRYVGDVVAVVAAETEEIAKQAIKKIKVEYEPLPAVFDPVEALNESAPKVHDSGNLVTHFKIRKGNVTEGFKKSDVIIEREYRTPFVDQAYLEPDGSIAIPEGTGITIYCATQNPFTVRQIVSTATGLPMSKVRIIQSTLGGGFGGKSTTSGIIAARAALLAMKTGRPVKMIYTREEVMTERYKRHPYIMRYKVGATRDGKLTAMEIVHYADAGAYSDTSTFVLFRSTVQCTGPYEVPNVKLDAYAVYTNNIYSGAMRGFGSPQVNFAVESLMDELAKQLDIDPLELRLKNAFKQGSETATGQKLTGHTVSMRNVLKKVAEISEWYKKRELYKKDNGRYRRGIGIAGAYRGANLGGEALEFGAAVVLINEDGTVLVTSGLAENGQGLKTVVSQIVAETLGIPYEYVNYIDTDTGIAPDSGETVASRGTMIGGNAAIDAATKLKERLALVASELLGVPKNELIFRNGEIYWETNPGKKVSFVDVVQTCYVRKINLTATGFYSAPNLSWDPESGRGDAYMTYAYHANVVEVTVDTETGKVFVNKVYAVHDVGRVINPKTIRGQVYSGILMALGYALKEKFIIENGHPKTLNFDTYKIMRATEIPDIVVAFIENIDPFGPYGAKGIGEPAMDTGAPATINAIDHAVGVRIRELPATREKIINMLKTCANPHPLKKE